MKATIFVAEIAKFLTRLGLIYDLFHTIYLKLSKLYIFYVAVFIKLGHSEFQPIPLMLFFVNFQFTMLIYMNQSSLTPLIIHFEHGLTNDLTFGTFSFFVFHLSSLSNS